MIIDLIFCIGLIICVIFGVRQSKQFEKIFGYSIHSTPWINEKGELEKL